MPTETYFAHAIIRAMHGAVVTDLATGEKRLFDIESAIEALSSEVNVERRIAENATKTRAEILQSNGSLFEALATLNEFRAHCERLTFHPYDLGRVGVLQKLIELQILNCINQIQA